MSILQTAQKRSDTLTLPGTQESNIPSKQIQVIQGLCEFIAENSQDKLTLSKLSEKSGLSPFHLQRTFKKVTGVTPKEYIEATRLDRIKLSLRGGNSIRKSTYIAGYNTTGWLYFRPNQKLGMSPLTYKSGGKGLKICCIITQCPLGRLLVAATERGICRVSIADSDQRLFASLRGEYPNAELVRNDSQSDAVSLAVEKILDYLTKGSDLARSNLPLDLQATAFQMRVWKELSLIPYGEVRSYSEIARRVGLPKATRAVANACGANPVPLVIPCHRVIRKNGDLGGYGLGIERKKILLQNEGAKDSLPQVARKKRS